MICRWHAKFKCVDLATHVVKEYRLALDRQTADQVLNNKVVVAYFNVLPLYTPLVTDLNTFVYVTGCVATLFTGVARQSTRVLSCR